MYIPLFAAITILLSCKEHTGAFSITVTKETVLPDIPSGSATLYYNDSLLIIGDDATAIYQLDPSGSHKKYPILVTDTTKTRIQKDEKLDLEAAVLDTVDSQPCLLAFGSGSIRLKRDTLMIAAVADLSQQRFYSLEALYEFLRQQTNTAVADWNIEAASVSNGYLILFNRGTNAMIKLPSADFAKYLKEKTMPVVSSHPVKLPLYKGHTPGISGACTLADGTILFCASVEDTKNWYDDGEVLGSYVGLIDPATGELKHLAPLTDKNGSLLKIKLESVDVTTETKGLLEVAAVADNDNGSTLLLRLEIKR